MMRNNRANAVMKAVARQWKGKTVQLTGFAIPLKKSDGRVTEYLLVSQKAMCSHGQLPPANQVVFAKSADGIVINKSSDPIVVTGTIIAEKTEKMIFTKNGIEVVVAGFSIVPRRIKPYRKDEIRTEKNPHKLQTRVNQTFAEDASKSQKTP
jgi:hypothetical protein